MNKDQIKGGAKEVAGTVQRKAGEVLGSTEQQAKGLAKEISGKAQKNLGNVEEKIKDASRDDRALKDDRDLPDRDLDK